MHQFVISGLDFRIAAGFCPETASSVQRFLISGGEFGNHCRFFPRNDLSAAVILDFRGSIWESLQRGMVSPAVVVAATRSVSDSNFRSGKEEWFRL